MVNMILRAVGLLLVGACGVCVAEDADMQVICDFDSGTVKMGEKEVIGAWDCDPQDPSQSCEISFSETEHVGDSGASLRIDYDVMSPKKSYTGIWVNLQHVSLEGYTYLAFDVKGDRKLGYTKSFIIEIKGGGQVKRREIKSVSTAWKTVSLPLKWFRFEGLGTCEEFTIVFEDTEITRSRRQGTIYLDNLAVYKSHPSRGRR